MNMPSSRPPTAEDYKCRFEFQDGWVDLTLDERDESEALAVAARAANEFNDLELTVSSRKLVDDMVSRALYLNNDEPNLAASYYTRGGVRLADMMLDSYGDEGVPQPEPAEVTPLLLSWSNAVVVGEPDVAYMDLADCAAVRVQGVVKTKRRLGLGSQLGEFIKYAIFPQGFNTISVVTFNWDSTANSDELTQLADELVATMSLVYVDAGGNEISGSQAN
ncbi:hypothetical protein ACQB60_26245 [Actinomycetota bacterium Odt1-20B]